MRARVLGSAAGGGFPQWNCGCPGCTAVRSGRAVSRTQDSLAIAADGADDWFLVNASPDVHRQIAENRFLWPRGPRHSPIAGILLTNGDLDHVLGLFSLRESHPLVIYATESVWSGLSEGNAIFRTLRRFPTQVAWRQLVLGETMALAGPSGEPSGLTVTALPAPGKLPVHLMAARPPSDEDNVGLIVRQGERSIGYFASCAKLGAYADAIRDLDVLLFDGTFFTSDEIIRLGLGTSRAEDMAHWPIGGDEGSLAALGKIAKRRVYTHLNNTNPVLLDATPERAAVEAAGWEIAFDGMILDP